MVAPTPTTEKPMVEIEYEISKNVKQVNVDGQPHAWLISGQLIFKYLTDADRSLLGFPKPERQKYAELETYHFMPFSEHIPYDSDKAAVAEERAEKRIKAFMDRLNTSRADGSPMAVSGNIKEKYRTITDYEKELER